LGAGKLIEKKAPSNEALNIIKVQLEELKRGI